MAIKKTQACIACGKQGLVFHRAGQGNFYLYDADPAGNPILSKRHVCTGKKDSTAVPAQGAQQDTGDPNITAAGPQTVDQNPPAPGQAQGQGQGQQKQGAAMTPEQAEAQAKGNCTVKISAKTGTGQGDGNEQGEGEGQPEEQGEDFIPPTIDFDGPGHENLDMLCYWLIEKREPCALFGESGSFKSTTARQIADKLFPNAVKTTAEGGTINTKFFPMSFNNQTSKGDIKGYMDAMGVFQPSPFYFAYKFGGVFLADEYDAGNDNTNLLFNLAFSNKCFTFGNGETVPMHRNCFAIAGTNTTGNGADRVFTGRNEIDGAAKERWTWITWDVNPHLELLVAGPDQHEWVSYVQALRAIRKELGITSNLITPRASIKGAKALRDGKTWSFAERSLITSTLTADEWQQLEANLPIQLRNLRNAKGCK